MSRTAGRVVSPSCSATSLSVITTPALDSFTGQQIARVLPWYVPFGEDISAAQRLRWDYNVKTFNGGTLTDVPLSNGTIIPSVTVLDAPGSAAFHIRETSATAPGVGVQVISADTYDDWIAGMLAEFRCAGDLVDASLPIANLTAEAKQLTALQKLEHGCGIAGAGIGVIAASNQALTRGVSLFVTSDPDAADAYLTTHFVFWGLLKTYFDIQFMTPAQFKSVKELHIASK